MTFAEMISSVQRWMRENLDEDLVMESLSDSATSIWETLVLVNLSEFLGGPATGTFAQVNQGSANIVSITDPPIGPTLAAVVQGALPTANPHVRYTYVTDSGAETAASPETNVVLPDNNILKVVAPPRNPAAIGWNVYVDNFRQNEVPIPQGQDWYEDEVNGFTEEGEEYPTTNNTADDIWYLQELTVTLPDGSEMTWEEQEVGSELWRRFARSTASNNPYQPYVYDFDGSKVNIRPLSGGSIDFNYFYVRRPRQFKYKSATIPFRHPGATVFMKYNAMCLLHLALHEYTAAQGWEKKAEQERLAIVMSANKHNQKKNKVVKPMFR